MSIESQPNLPNQFGIQPNSEIAGVQLVRRGRSRVFSDGLIPDGSRHRGLNFEYSKIRDVGGNDLVFEDCLFSFSTFNRAYFRRARFKNCKFIGCFFSHCNFRGAEFSGCDFSYSTFEYSQLDSADFFNQLPQRPNVRRELARSLRMNAHSMGDAEELLECFWYEMLQEKTYLREAAEGKEEYYQRKYPGPLNRVRFRLRFFQARIGGFIWGHGESPARILRTAFIAWLALSVAILLFGSSVGSPSAITATPDAVLFSMKHAFFLMLNAGVDGFRVDNTTGLAIKGTAALSGFTLFGLTLATIMRRYVRR